MTPRKWFIFPEHLKKSDDKEMEFPSVRRTGTHDDYMPLYVFTEEELRKLWNTADQIGWRKGRDHQLDPNVQRKYTSLDDYLSGALELQQKFGGK